MGMETEQPQFKYSIVVLDFQLCVLRLVRWVCCGDYHPWNVLLNVCPGVLLWSMWTMRCQTFGLLSFFRRGAFCCVETKKEEKAWRPLWTKLGNSQVQESCYERIRCTCKQVCTERCKCFRAACCAQSCAYASRQGFLTGKGQLR